MAINPEYIRQLKQDEFRSWKVTLDASDTIFATNYFLGYYGNSNHASELMQRQRKVDLQRKRLWHNYQTPFLDNIVVRGSDFGINIYFAGSVKQGQKNLPDYVKLLDLTSSHINLGGWSCLDFVITYTTEHDTVQFFSDREIPHDEYVLGFIRLDSGTLSCKPLQEHIDVGNLRPEFVNEHVLNGKVIVPTQPFGSLFRGGKLIALLAQSNELRDFFNERYNTNIVLYYTMSLYGSTKDSSMYDQLDRHLRFIGTTTSRHPLRMKNPHKNNLVDWLDGRGISRFNFKRGDSSAEDKIFRNLIHYLEYCLLINREDPTINKLRKQFKSEIERVINQVERKRVYVGTYGLDNWDDNLINSSREVNEDNNLQNLFDYWKRKVYQRKDWGMRKNRHILNSEEAYHYELL